MERVIVFKDRASREIKTYVNLHGHGAEMSVTDFIALVAELYGSPATTLTVKGHAEALQEAAAAAIMRMKEQTREVAAVSL